MQEPLFPSTLSGKLYHERAVLIATFLGGPLAGGYLLAQNFTTLQDPAKVNKAWLGTIGALLFIMISVFIPVLDKLPPVAWSFAFCWTAHFAARKYQGSQIALHQANGGLFFSTWRAVAVGLVSMLLMVIAIVGLMYLSDPAAF